MLNPALNPAPSYDLPSMYSKRSDCYTRVQRAAELVSKRTATPESDPLRPHLIRLAYMALDHQRAAHRRIVQQVAEAELAEAEQLLAVAQSPAVRTVLEAEVARLRADLTLIAA